MPTINNFDEIRRHLRFDKAGDIYAVHVLFRVKDLRSEEEKQMFLSHDETQRKIKSWFIESFEHWDKKVPQMIDLAVANKARVYVSMTKKNRLVCNRILAKKVIDEIDNPHIKYDGMITSAVCGCHISDWKWWTLDVDNDTEICLPKIVPIKLTNILLQEKTYEVTKSAPPCKLVDVKDKVIAEMAKLVDETKIRSGSEIFTVPTKNGCHIMTPPFNKSKMAFLGDNLKTDAMTLAYFQWED